MSIIGPTKVQTNRQHQHPTRPPWRYVGPCAAYPACWRNTTPGATSWRTLSFRGSRPRPPSDRGSLRRSFGRARAARRPTLNRGAVHILRPCGPAAWPLPTRACNKTPGVLSTHVILRRRSLVAPFRSLFPKKVFRKAAVEIFPQQRPSAIDQKTLPDAAGDRTRHLPFHDRGESRCTSEYPRLEGPHKGESMFSCAISIAAKNTTTNAVTSPG